MPTRIGAGTTRKCVTAYMDARGRTSKHLFFLLIEIADVFTSYGSALRRCSAKKRVLDLIEGEPHERSRDCIGLSDTDRGRGLLQ